LVRILAEKENFTPAARLERNTNEDAGKMNRNAANRKKISGIQPPPRVPAFRGGDFRKYQSVITAPMQIKSQRKRLSKAQSGASPFSKPEYVRSLIPSEYQRADT